MTAKKSVEQKLFEAFQQGRGVRLSAEDVWVLVSPDDAVGTRLSNVAADEAGVDMDHWPGCDSVPRGDNRLTWAQFKRLMKEESAR